METPSHRYYTVVTTFTPTADLMTAIYAPILDKHLEQKGFAANVKALKVPLVQTSIDVLVGILNNPAFLPSAAKFHYQFNLKDIANIFQVSSFEELKNGGDFDGGIPSVEWGEVN